MARVLIERPHTKRVGVKLPVDKTDPIYWTIRRNNKE